MRFLPRRVLLPLNLIEFQLGFEAIQLLFVSGSIELLLGLVDLLLLLGLGKVGSLLLQLIQLLLRLIQLLVAFQLVQLLALARLIDLFLLARLGLFLLEFLELVGGRPARGGLQYVKA